MSWGMSSCQIIFMSCCTQPIPGRQLIRWLESAKGLWHMISSAAFVNLEKRNCLSNCRKEYSAGKGERENTPGFSFFI
jgi:hypothetical protein